MIARFPGQCVVCGGDIVPRQTEVEYHPTIRGPKGGKKVCHAECLTRSNPMVSVRRNSGGCGCGGYGCWSGDCSYGGLGYISNPAKRRFGSEHYALMEQVKRPQLQGRDLEAALAAEALADFNAERNRSRGRGRGRRSR